MKRVIWKVILVICLVGVGVSGYNVIRLSKEYREGIKEYANLEQYVTITQEPIAEKQVTTNQEVQEEVVKESLIPVSMDIAYDELKKINEHFTGWIYYEPLELSYPIVRGNDNDYYTHYTFENEQNSSGAIFLDFLNKPDFSNYNTIIYGHNMRNGTMFGTLKQLLNDTSIQEENPYFYVFTENKAYMYEIFAVYVTTADSHTYDLIEDEEQQSIYLDYIKGCATWLSDIEVTESDRIATLSTCHGLHTNNRTVVHGKLIVEEDR